MAGLVLVLLAAGWPGAGAVLRARYADPDSATSALRSVRGARVAVVGIPTKYGYAGTALANRVDYLGRRDARGVLVDIADCATWRHRLAGYDYAVVAASQAFGGPYPPALGWTRPLGRVVYERHRVVIVRLFPPRRWPSC